MSTLQATGRAFCGTMTRAGHGKTGAVEPELAEAVRRGGVAPDRIVTDIRELHPKPEGIRFVEEHDWHKEPSEVPALTVYTLAGSATNVGGGTQQVTFDREGSLTRLYTTNGPVTQIIEMSTGGKIIKNETLRAPILPR